jgi:son of sevenless-like protein
MSVPPPFNRPQSLHLHLQIGTSPELRGPTPVPPSPLSSFARREPWGYESPSGEYYGRICSVIGLYDFFSSDPDRLSFRKHDILEIVRQDESGWWGAVRNDGSEIGWIPAKFVRALSDDAAHRVSDIRERTRIPEFLADAESVRSAPPLRQIVDTPSSGTAVPDHEPSDITQVSPPPSAWSDPSIVTERPREPTAFEITDHLRNSPPNSMLHEIEVPPPARVSLTVVPPVPQGPKSLLKLDKSLPASPDGTAAPSSAGAQPKIVAHGRNASESAINLPDNTLSLPGPSTVVRVHSDQLSPFVSSLDVPPSPLTFPPNARPRPGKVLQLTGDDSAQAFHNAKQAQANLPWYLKHRHGEEEIKLEFDGTVKAGTLPALVEHLVVDSLRENRFSAPQLSLSDCFAAGARQQENFRRAFLVTFRTFATATEVFDLLVAQYELDVPSNLSEEEFKQWKREKLWPTRKRVLTVLTMWLEEYDLLNRDAEVAPKLQDFLCLIVSPAALALTAKHILKSLERLVSFKCIVFSLDCF